MDHENTALFPDSLRLRLDIAYDGTDFSGWAMQTTQRTVCGEVTRALQTILQTSLQLTVAGRTDAGVHATGQVAHVDVPRSILDTRSIQNNPQRLVRRLARLLPHDVTVTSVQEVPETFDARFSALRRHYVYRVANNPAGPNPLRARDTAHWFRPLNVDDMQEASQKLLGLNNFGAFCKHREGGTTIRELQRFDWAVSEEPMGPVLEAFVTADAFCWSMVRSLVGAMFLVGDGRKPVDWPASLLGAEKRYPQVPVAESRGLCLYQVDYPPLEELGERQQKTRDVRSAHEVDEKP